jgi:hypothetical protein
MGSRKIAAGAHILLAAVHIYWATGATWPAPDERTLSRAVLGTEVSFAPQVVLPLAALHLALAFAVLRSDRYPLARLVVGGLVIGLAARAAVGLVWAFGDTGSAFYWLNLFLYTPACLALLVIDVGLIRSSRSRLGEFVA